MSAAHLITQFTAQIRRDRKYRHWVLLALYGRQTHREQVCRATRLLNHMGFNAPDAPVLSRLAEALHRGEELDAAAERVLTNRLPKYWGQFTTLAFPERHGPKRRGVPGTSPSSSTHAERAA